MPIVIVVSPKAVRGAVSRIQSLRWEVFALGTSPMPAGFSSFLLSNVQTDRSSRERPCSCGHEKRVPCASMAPVEEPQHDETGQEIGQDQGPPGEDFEEPFGENAN